MILLICQTIKINESNYMRYVGQNNTLFFYYSPVCPKCQDVDAKIDELAITDVDVFLVNC